jgi:hypothetical protein
VAEHLTPFPPNLPQYLVVDGPLERRGRGAGCAAACVDRPDGDAGTLAERIRDQVPGPHVAGDHDQLRCGFGEVLGDGLRDVARVRLPGVLDPCLEVLLRPVVAPGAVHGIRRRALDRLIVMAVRVHGEDVRTAPVGDDEHVRRLGGLLREIGQQVWQWRQPAGVARRRVGQRGGQAQGAAGGHRHQAVPAGGSAVGLDGHVERGQRLRVSALRVQVGADVGPAQLDFAWAGLRVMACVEVHGREWARVAVHPRQSSGLGEGVHRVSSRRFLH